MRVTDLLKQQHDHVAALMERAREEANDAARLHLLGRIAEELTLHAAIEEHFVYSMLESVGLAEDAERSVNEHQIVRELIARLLELERHDPEVGDTLDQLDDAVREHVQAEEQGLFPLLYSRIPAEELDRLGAEMEEAIHPLRKQELLKLAEHRETPRIESSPRPTEPG